MNYLRICSMALVALISFAGSVTSAIINVDLIDPDYYRSFYSPELVEENGAYKADFTDTFIFTLTKSGKLSFTLSEQDNHGMFLPSWVNITSVGFTGGPAPTSVTPWEKKDPYYDHSNLISSFVWDFLAAGTYNLTVTGSAYATGGFASTFYWMEDVAFIPSSSLGNPHLVPEPSTMALAGLGLLGIAGFFRVRRRR